MRGRREERQALGGLLRTVRGGQSRVLVVYGEPGVGKTALVESAISCASGFRVLRSVGLVSRSKKAAHGARLFAVIFTGCSAQRHSTFVIS